MTNHFVVFFAYILFLWPETPRKSISEIEICRQFDASDSCLELRRSPGSLQFIISDGISITFLCPQRANSKIGKKWGKQIQQL